MNIRDTSHIRWRPASAVQPPPELARWLLDGSSLTRRLNDWCGRSIDVTVEYQGWSAPRMSEARLLSLRPRRAALLREVRLSCGTPLVFARTVIPNQTLTGPNRALARLGQRPLGAVLFADPTLERCGFEVIRIPEQDPRYRRITSGQSGPPVWGRRSLFRIRRQPLLVTEFFLTGGPWGSE